MAEGLPDLTGIAVGCFADPGFAPPWAALLGLAAAPLAHFHNELTLLDTQDG